MNEYHGSMLGQNQVWLPRQRRPVKAKPQAQSMQSPPDSDFRFGVLPANSRHHAATGSRVYHIGHACEYTGLMPIALWK